MTVSSLLTYKGKVDGILYDTGSDSPQGWIQLFIGNNDDGAWAETASGNMKSARCFARPHFTVKSDGAQYIDIPYALFFPFNGAPEQGVVGGVAYVTNVGAHEGDWEHITVRLSIPGEEIVAIYYSAHGKADSTWYFAPAAALDDQNAYLQQERGYKMLGGQVVAFAAKNSHGMYNRVGEAVLRTIGEKGANSTERTLGGALLPYEATGLGEKIDCGSKMDVVTPQDGNSGETKLSWIKFPGRWGSYPPFGVLGDDGPLGPRFKDWWVATDPEIGTDAVRFNELESN